MAKKIFALVAAVVLVVCFSVTSFAATVIPETKYVDGKAEVTVTVTGVDPDANVTYYATKNGLPVFVDQKKAESNGATFNFVTDIANVGSAVVVGYTGGAKDAGVIPDADKYSITYGGEELAQVYPGEGATVTIANPATDIQTVKSVKANGVEVAFSVNGDEITVTLSNVTAETEITVEVERKEIPAYNEQLLAIDAGAVEVKVSEDPAYEGGIKIDGLKENEDDLSADVEDANKIASANADKVGDRKLTVCGKAGNYDKFGIIVSTEEIADGSYFASEFDALGTSYEAITKGTDNKFAVQLIDTSDKGSADSFVVSGTDYYTAVYGYSAANNAYYVVASASVVAAN